jgi:hypothetical protein
VPPTMRTTRDCLSSTVAEVTGLDRPGPREEHGEASSLSEGRCSGQGETNRILDRLSAASGESMAIVTCPLDARLRTARCPPPWPPASAPIRPASHAGIVAPRARSVRRHRHQDVSELASLTELANLVGSTTVLQRVCCHDDWWAVRHWER